MKRILPLILALLCGCDDEVVIEDETPDVMYVTEHVWHETRVDVYHTTVVVEEDTTPDVIETTVYEYPSGPVPCMVLEEEGVPAMADSPLSGLTAATGLTVEDLMLITQSGSSKKATLQLLRQFLGLDASAGFYEHEDFIAIDFSTMIPYWFIFANGAGTDVDIGNPYQGRTHLALIQTGTSATASVGFYRGIGSGSLELGAGETILEASVLVKNLSDGTDRYEFYVQFGDGYVSSDNNDGVYFKYSDNVNSGKWQLLCSSGGTTTTADSGITVAADTWYKLRAVINAAGTSVEFFIDGVSVGTITTNIPTGTSNLVSPCVRALKKLGTTNRLLYCDYITFQQLLTTPR
jgi:hypothetical protein